ncbi:MAG: hypothetical protein U1E76_15605 [Planctomycetota bacterium]
MPRGRRLLGGLVLLATGSLAAFLAVAVHEALFVLDVTELEVAIRGLPEGAEGLRPPHLSDLHSIVRACASAGCSRSCARCTLTWRWSPATS